MNPVNRLLRNNWIGFSLIVCLGIFWFGSSLNAQDDVPDKTVTISLAENAIQVMAAEVLREAYKRIGYKAIFSPLPTKRALIWANEGKTDGDVARILRIDKEFTNLARVPTPVITAYVTAFTINTTREIREWEDLRGSRVGIIRGMWFAVTATEGMDRFFADDMRHLFKLLQSGRIDIAVTGGEIDGRVQVARNFKNSGIHKTGEPLQTIPLYHYVHKRNKRLVADLDTALSLMAKEGTLDLIAQQKLRELMNLQE